MSAPANAKSASPADDSRDDERSNTSSGSPDTGVKRQGSAAQKENGRSNGDAQDTGRKAKRRRKVNHACVYCRRSHMTCDQARPCSRCIKRDIGHLCHDEPRETKRAKSDPDAQGNDIEMSPTQQRSHGSMASDEVKQQPMRVDTSVVSDAISPSRGADTANLATIDAKTNANQGFGGNDQQMFNDWNNQNPFQFQQEIHNFHPNYMFNTSEVNNEFNLLGDFLSNSLMDDGAMYSGEEQQPLLTDPSFANVMGTTSSSNDTFNGQHDPLVPTPRGADGRASQQPTNTVRMDKAQEKYYMEAADPTGTEPPEERMNKLLKAKYDAGLLKPFNYVKGYARLMQYMEKHLHPMSRQKILRQLDAFRPKFRERMYTLTDVELIRVEMWFEMKLMDYDRVFASMAIPACAWRRTGEIFRGNREMAELIDVPLEQLREGKFAIHDMICEESLVMYWTKFGQIAFDSSKKAMLASCTLKKPTGEVDGPLIRCCFSFTVQRDDHQIPSIIIGNFLPVSSANTT